MRKPLIVGNWKMHKLPGETRDLIEGLRSQLDGYETVEVVVCPPFTSLGAAADALEGSTIALGAQNVHWESEGAYTGEISAEMLLDVGCKYAIIGHSERRELFGEVDRHVKRRLRRVLETSLVPIVCVGETLDERNRGRMEDVVLGELEQAVEGLSQQSLRRLVIAYEPVWAIGTGETATPETAQEVHQMIREWLKEVFSEEIGEHVPILYGGSVKPANAAALMAEKDIDGALVGGASLTADSFTRIVKYQ